MQTKLATVLLHGLGILALPLTLAYMTYLMTL